MNEGQAQVPPSSATNTPPSIDGTPPTSGRAGTAYSFTPTAADRNSDPLTFEIFGKPAWASFNTATGALTGTPGDADVGMSAQIEISVSDGKAQSSMTGFRIQVAARTAPSNGTGSALINWTPPTTNTDGSALTDLAGYRIRYGTSAGSLDQVVEVASAGVSNRMVEGLAAGTWFFAVVAYSASGVESTASNTATKTIQ